MINRNIKKTDNMKKFYLAVAATLFATCAQAQTLQFKLGDQVLEPGQKVEYNEIEITDEPDYYEWSIEPPLYIVGSETENINATAKCTSGHQIMFCMGLSCQFGTDVSIENYQITANKPEYVQFHINGYDKNIPTDIITNFLVYYTNNEDVSTTLTLILNNSQVKTATIYEEGEELVSINGALEYSVNGTSDLTLYTTDGRRVLNQTVSGNGSVSTASLANGVYVYTLGTKSGKVIVK